MRLCLPGLPGLSRRLRARASGPAARPRSPPSGCGSRSTLSAGQPGRRLFHRPSARSTTAPAAPMAARTAATGPTITAASACSRLGRGGARRKAPIRTGGPTSFTPRLACRPCAGLPGASRGSAGRVAERDDRAQPRLSRIFPGRRISRAVAAGGVFRRSTGSSSTAACRSSRPGLFYADRLTTVSPTYAARDPDPGLRRRARRRCCAGAPTC